MLDVEVVGLAASDGVLLYEVSRRRLSPGEPPDVTARRVAPTGVEVLHSTSWRYEPEGVVVLTYVAAPVPVTPGMRRLVEPSVVCSGDPLVPGPDQMHAHHVVAHGVRHLSDLLDRDPAISAAAASSARTAFWCLVRATREVPTDTHADAHRRAHGRPIALTSTDRAT